MSRQAPFRRTVSFPRNDVSTLEWWAAQEDPSLSIKMLIRAEIERYGYTDTANRPVQQLPRRGRPPKAEQASPDATVWDEDSYAEDEDLDDDDDAAEDETDDVDDFDEEDVVEVEEIVELEPELAPKPARTKRPAAQRKKKPAQQQLSTSSRSSEDEAAEYDDILGNL